MPKKSSGPAKEPKKYILKSEAPKEDFIDHVKDAFVDAAIAKDDEGSCKQARERFGIVDRGSASWAAGKFAEAEAEVERRKMHAKTYILDAERKLDRLKWMFWEALKEWARSNLDYGKRSVKLPTATLTFRDVAARLEVVDEEALTKWALVELPDAITTVEQIVMDPLKNFWMKSNVVPPGTVEIPKGENFDVKG